ncbi:low-density lipoprotein receptor-related [Holotrichia oblita]|uniref:Low-density lipoprotein receptor-related n=1 Tax=Holotrichia oblita TaxID=644536 RepID=A0ACB9SI00_HOLOL|nr:low-density lipoprotein receptor-related [Holotrichia oblita]
MHHLIAFNLFLGLIYITNCDVSLQIIRNTDENYTPVNNAISERAGTNLTLSCELLSDVNDNKMDDQITWEKASPQISLRTRQDLEQLTKKTKTFYSILKPSDTNKAVKNFIPLKLEDTGMYFCISFKYLLFKAIYINVGNNTQTRVPFKNSFNSLIREECGPKMFQCMLNGVCINQVYVCDGHKDCPDGSDEAIIGIVLEKLQCDDGRCIPSFWCCDRHHDVNCNVTYRPDCCQQLSDSYDDLESPNNITETKSTDSRYFFITFCILATFVSVILMLLIVSRVFIFANKTACAHPRNIFQLEELTLRQNNNDITPFQSNLLSRSYRNRLILSNVRYVDNCNEVLEPISEVSDPLLSPGSPERGICRIYIQDQPPSYSEVVENQSEPPPPYTSREYLNVSDDRSRRD